MYLSRIQLDVGNRQTVKAISAPGIMHGAVESAFVGEREHALWRVDQLRGKTYLLTLSENKPDLAVIQNQFGFQDECGESKNYNLLLNRIQNNTKWYFKLTANPTWSEKRGNGERGKVHAHKTVSQQRDWLIRQAERHGFAVEAEGFDIMESKPISFRKGKEGGRPVTLISVTYEGVLQVTDSVLFRQALVSGIGRGKAYGMGLLTVVGCE